MGAALVTQARCSPERVRAPEGPPPVLAQPADAVPADLDAVFRIELDAMRDVLGPSMSEAMERRAREGQPGGVLGEVLQFADTVWIGIRPGLPMDLTDNVIVLRGRFSGFDPRRHDDDPSGWQPRIDLGGGWWRYDRPKPKIRSRPARLYLRPDDLLVLVSVAELDSTERTMEQGARDERLRPPERGDLSVAVRLPPVLPLIDQHSPALAGFLQGATELEMTAKLSTTGLKAEAEVMFTDPDSGRRALASVQRLSARAQAGGGLLSKLAHAARTEVVGASVIVSVEVGSEALGDVFRCLESGTSCGS